MPSLLRWNHNWVLWTLVNGSHVLEGLRRLRALWYQLLIPARVQVGGGGGGGDGHTK